MSTTTTFEKSLYCLKNIFYVVVTLVQLNTYAEIIHCGNVSQQRKEGKQLDQS
jgi:hypothetical protein